MRLTAIGFTARSSAPFKRGEYGKCCATVERALEDRFGCGRFAGSGFTQDDEMFMA
jgi:hypothetical protein